MTHDKVSMLNDIGFGWERPRKSIATNGASNSTSMAMNEIKKQKKESAKDLEAVMMDEEPTESGAPEAPPCLESNKHTSPKALDNAAAGAALISTEDEDDDDDKNDAEDTVAVEPPPTPNMGFLEQSLGGAAWLADGAKSLLKMFVAF